MSVPLKIVPVMKKRLDLETQSPLLSLCEEALDLCFEAEKKTVKGWISTQAIEVLCQAVFLCKDTDTMVLGFCSQLFTSQFTSAPSLSVKKALLGREAHFLREQSERIIR